MTSSPARQRNLRTTVVAGRRRLAALGVVAVVGAGLVPVLSTPASAATARDGRTEATALASCWDVKQTTPAATDGVYWLYTPALGHPQQFYCDMTTDGGGWTLIGRGREGWAFLPEGQGTNAEVAGTVTGTAAFAPKHLSTAAVNGLLNGTKVKDLTDGVRIRRAANTAGSSWQEVRVRPSQMGEWRWAITNAYFLTSISFNGTSFASTGVPGASGTWTFGTACPNQTTSCLDLRRKQTHQWKPGFAYGSNQLGSTASTSYLWAPTATTGAAIPFAQVFVRPRTRWADLSIPSAVGLAGSTKRLMFDNTAQTQTHGVSGLANGLSTERDTEVRAFAQVGSRMYVGGNFAQVDTYPTGSNPQKYLAAFDIATGNHVPAFAPVLNGKVNALAALPDGNLAVGGEFTTVNGATQAGLVVVNPTTGATVASYNVRLERRSSTGTVPGTVTGLDVAGGWLYAGGQFTHVAGGTSGFVYAKRGVRISTANARPDASWNPAFDGSPVFVEASPAGDRVYFGGFMATMNDGAAPADKFVAVTTTTPARPVAGLAAWVPSTTPAKYQQTGVEADGRFVLGGAEHSFHVYARDGLQFVRGNITRSDRGVGGDFQASVADSGVVYGSCHCDLSTTFGGATTYNLPSGYDDADLLRYVGAYDLQTGRYQPDFMPWIQTRATRGPWALTVDSNQCLWVGGDLTQTRRTSDNAWQTSGGFARFCRNDVQAPTVPTALRATKAADGTLTLNFTGSTDNRAGTLRYTVFQDDVPVATTTSWKITRPATDAAGTYVVRGFDKAGNVSATSAPLTVS